MKAIIEWQSKKIEIDFSAGIDLSLPLQNGEANPNAFHIPFPLFEPIKVGDFVGAVSQGSSANCENLFINAHGNGTHTECIGHITLERNTINGCLTDFHCMAQVVSLALVQTENGDAVIPLANAQNWLNQNVDAVVIRSLPNEPGKKLQQYSGNNPGYLSAELCHFFAVNKIKHLLVDLPSVDREEDGGAMAAHKAFWQYPEQPRMAATITEMAFVPNEVPDGIYFLNLQIASFESDASPSKPVLYALKLV
ncbi:MAG: cyclase family protein [bacterium]|nr:cyclase family protein [bacterium]